MPLYSKDELHAHLDKRFGEGAWELIGSHPGRRGGYQRIRLYDCPNNYCNGIQPSVVTPVRNDKGLQFEIVPEEWVN